MAMKPKPMFGSTKTEVAPTKKTDMFKAGAKGSTMKTTGGKPSFKPFGKAMKGK